MPGLRGHWFDFVFSLPFCCWSFIAILFFALSFSPIFLPCDFFKSLFGYLNFERIIILKCERNIIENFYRLVPMHWYRGRNFFISYFLCFIGIKGWSSKFQLAWAVTYLSSDLAGEVNSYCEFSLLLVTSLISGHHGYIVLKV